ncbi:MAG: hypothetical protein TEF_10275 [Rhizobiales bacterium NRL2]|jgi:hypothetical protein|nr:MAG: hypothetical protein TEF_10275 [Rhizobiales bacterium NRL2]
MLPFTTDQFLEVFTAYNQAIWPLQIVTEALGLAMTGCLFIGNGGAQRAAFALLGAMWLLMGVGYHLTFFAQINPAANVFGALFILQAVLFAIEGAWRGRISMRLEGGFRAWLAGALIAYALIIYPMIGLLGAQPYPETPLFGVAPCPTVIFTLGLLILADHPQRWMLATIPLVWSLIGGSAAVLLEVPQDFGLAAAGMFLVIAMLSGRRSRHDNPGY